MALLLLLNLGEYHGFVSAVMILLIKIILAWSALL